MSGRDGLGAVLREHRAGGYFAALDGHRECYCGHVMAADESYEAHLESALLASGAAIDAATVKAEALRDAAEDIRTNAAHAWGGEQSWLATGSKVANLAASWLDESAATLSERTS